jgi:hypothetical protein
VIVSLSARPHTYRHAPFQSKEQDHFVAPLDAGAPPPDTQKRGQVDMVSISSPQEVVRVPPGCRRRSIATGTRDPEMHQTGLVRLVEGHGTRLAS